MLQKKLRQQPLRPFLFSSVAGHSTMVQIILKTLSGSSRCFELPSGSSLLDLKHRISELEGVPLEHQRLISNDIVRNLFAAQNSPRSSDPIFVTLVLSLPG